MVHPRGVRLLEAVGDLVRDGQQLVGRHRTVREHVLETLPLHQLHRDEGSFLALGDLIDGGDVGVVESRRDVSLLEEPLSGEGIGGELYRQELERHGAAQLRVVGTIDRSHSATAEFFDDLVTVCEQSAACHGFDWSFESSSEGRLGFIR